MYFGPHLYPKILTCGGSSRSRLSLLWSKTLVLCMFQSAPSANFQTDLDHSPDMWLSVIQKAERVKEKAEHYFQRARAKPKKEEGEDGEEKFIHKHLVHRCQG